jgi:hypothetical protein
MSENQRDNIETWFRHLKTICFEVVESYQSLNHIFTAGALSDDLHRFHVSRTYGSFITIRTCAFLDEIEISGLIGSDLRLNQIVVNFKRITRPIVNEFNKWDDLWKYRNHIVAHNFRQEIKNKDGIKQFPSVFFNIEQYDAPKTITDIYLIAECMRMIEEIIDQILTREGFTYIDDSKIKGGVEPRLKPDQVANTLLQLNSEIKSIIDKLNADNSSQT